MQVKILFISNDANLKSSIPQILNFPQTKILVQDKIENLSESINKYKPDLTIINHKPPEFDYAYLIPKIKEIDEDITILIISAIDDTDTIVNSIKIGAVDFIDSTAKPESIRIRIKAILENVRLKKRVAILDEKERHKFENIIGESQQIKDINSMIKKIVQSKATTILIQGPSGTGKELVAKAIHYHSDRAKEDFVELNCSAIPENLLETELFGYEKGAFTDAKTQKKGLVEIADGGTLFLDEISDLQKNLQVKLLKFIETKEFRRIGGLEDLKTDVRIIAATNKDLKTLVEQDAFREDLYYRLKVVSIDLPPLKERGNDIILLAEHFIKIFNTEFKKNVKKISRQAKEILLSYNWPGNVRELKNVIERALLLENADTLMPDHLPRELLERKEEKSEDIEIPLIDSDSFLSLKQMERKHIISVLKSTAGNKTKAIKILGIPKATFYRKLKLLKIKEEKIIA